jgi:hypothetical protein
MSKPFTIEMKKSLANRIGNIKNKQDLKAIKKLITDNNPDLEKTENSNGMFLRFQILSNETYDKIKKFLDARDKQEKIKEIKSEIIDSATLSEEIKFLTENSENKNSSLSKKYRLTNEETNLMNRIKYEKNLEENSKNDEDDIFVHNSSKKKSK